VGPLYRPNGRGITATVDSNIMLSTLGSIVQDAYPETDTDVGVSRKASAKTVIGDVDASATHEEDVESQDTREPAPEYDSVEHEMDFRPSRPSYEAAPASHSVSGIRINVEKAVSTI
jgi:hypothetical protein